jgi:hypothetical protein
LNYQDFDETSGYHWIIIEAELAHAINFITTQISRKAFPL